MTRATKKEDVIVRLTKLTVVEGTGSTKCRFDYAIKLGDYAIENRGLRLTESMFEKKIRPYSSKFIGSNNQEVWHDKARYNSALEYKLLAEVETALAYAKKHGLAELKSSDFDEIYKK